MWDRLGLTLYPPSHPIDFGSLWGRLGLTLYPPSLPMGLWGFLWGGLGLTLYPPSHPIDFGLPEPDPMGRRFLVRLQGDPIPSPPLCALRRPYKRPRCHINPPPPDPISVGQPHTVTPMGHRCLHSLFCIFLGAASAPFGVWGRCGVGEGVGFGVSDGVELLWGGGCDGVWGRYGVGEAMGWGLLWG